VGSFLILYNYRAPNIPYILHLSQNLSPNTDPIASSSILTHFIFHGIPGKELMVRFTTHVWRKLKRNAI
jgi:hypothetical protein